MPFSPPAQVLRAGAMQIKRVKGRLAGPKRENWQEDAWDIYDQIGEIKQGTNFIADVCASTRLYVGRVPTGDEDNAPPADSSDVGYAEALDILDRMRVGSLDGGLEGLVRESIVNLKMVGDFTIVAEPPVPPNPLGLTLTEQAGRPERWGVYSTSEIKYGSKYIEIAESPGSKGRKIEVPDELVNADDVERAYAFVLRVWQRHPRYGALADCMMRALLLECDELLLLSRSIRAAVRSRLAMAGVAEVPNEYSFRVPAVEGDAASSPDLDPFSEAWGNAITEALADESSPDALAPIVVRASAKVMQESGGIQFKRPQSDMNEVAAKLRAELLGRLGSSLDIPWEQVSGMGTSTYSNAFQIDSATWGRYGQSAMRMLTQSWTQGILWALLPEYGVPEEAAQKLMIACDPANAIVDHDAGKTADELFDRGSISWDSHRRRKGANEEEAPSDDELAFRSHLGLLKGGGSAVSPGSEEPAATDPSVASITPITAAYRASISRRLFAIDQKLRTQLSEISEQALTRTLERAGARVRTASVKNQAMNASLSNIPAISVTQHIGQSAVAALGLTDDQLLAGSLEDYEPRFDTRIRTAQKRTRAELRRRFDLSDDDEQQLIGQQDRSRTTAVALLMGGLLALANDKLYSATPVETRGEQDVTTGVPASLVRQAMIEAGGGTQGLDSPSLGTALGVDVMQVWAQNGLTVTGYEWSWNGATNPLQGHEDLDGVAFDGWDDPVLTVRPEDSWLDREYYQPSDHSGCSCSVLPLTSDDGEPND